MGNFVFFIEEKPKNHQTVCDKRLRNDTGRSSEDKRADGNKIPDVGFCFGKITSTGGAIET